MRPLNGIIAGIYADELKGLGLGLPNPRKGVGHVYHLYVLRTPNQDYILEVLKDRGVGTAIHYPQPVHLQPAYKRLDFGLHETEQAVGKILSLPIFPELNRDDVLSVAGILKDIVRPMLNNSITLEESHDQG